MLANAAAKDDHPGFLRRSSQLVYPSDVGDNVDDQRIGVGLDRVETQHVS